MLVEHETRVEFYPTALATRNALTVALNDGLPEGAVLKDMRILPPRPTGNVKVMVFRWETNE